MPLTWFIAVPALIILFFSLGAIFLPIGPPRNRWLFVLIAVINVATVSAVLVTTRNEGASKPEVPIPSESGGDSEPVEEYWTSLDGLEKHTCPSRDCGVIGKFSFRVPLKVFATDADWARVSEQRKALCVNGRTRFIRKGNDLCDASNGIMNGTYFEWIEAKYLSKDLPSSGSSEVDEYEALVAGSEDYRSNRDVFADAARRLVNAGTCSKSEIEGQGGFRRLESSGSSSIYFAFCGGDTMTARVFVDVKTKEVFR